MKKQFWHSCLLLTVVILCCTSCADLVGVCVKRDQDVKDFAVQVDVIGITEQEKSAWAVTNVNQYWSHVMDGNGDPKAKSLQFSPGQKGDQNLKTARKGISYLVVISDYPNEPAGKYLGSEDPRFCIISLDKHDYGPWSSGITVQIHKNGISPNQ